MDISVQRGEILIDASNKLTEAYIDMLLNNLDLSLEFDSSYKNNFKLKSHTLDSQLFLPISSYLSKENEFLKEISTYNVYMGKSNDKSSLGYVNSTLKKIFILVPDLQLYIDGSLDKILSDYKDKIEDLKKNLFTKLADTNKRTNIDYVNHAKKQVGKAFSKLLNANLKERLIPVIHEQFEIIVHELNHTYDDMINPEIFSNYTTKKSVDYHSHLAEVISVVYQSFYTGIYKLSPMEIINTTFSKVEFLKKFIENKFFIKYYKNGNSKGNERFSTILTKLYNDYYNTNIKKISDMDFIENFKINFFVLEDKSDITNIFRNIQLLKYIKLLNKEKRTIIISKIAQYILSKLPELSKSEVVNIILGELKDNDNLPVIKKHIGDDENLINLIKKAKSKSNIDDIIDDVKISKDDEKDTRKILNNLIYGW